MTIAEFVMLINSGVWGLLHKSLSRDTQASAMDGLIATVLLAAAWALLPVQDLLPVPDRKSTRLNSSHT